MTLRWLCSWYRFRHTSPLDMHVLGSRGWSPLIVYGSPSADLNIEGIKRPQPRTFAKPRRSEDLRLRFSSILGLYFAIQVKVHLHSRSTRWSMFADNSRHKFYINQWSSCLAKSTNFPREYVAWTCSTPSNSVSCFGLRRRSRASQNASR